MNKSWEGLGPSFKGQQVRRDMYTHSDLTEKVISIAREALKDKDMRQEVMIHNLIIKAFQNGFIICLLDLMGLRLTELSLSEWRERIRFNVDDEKESPTYLKAVFFYFDSRALTPEGLANETLRGIMQKVEFKELFGLPSFKSAIIKSQKKYYKINHKIVSLKEIRDRYNKIYLEAKQENNWIRALENYS